MNCGVLAVVSDPGLRDEIDRIVAAAGLRVIHQPVTDAVDRKAWTAAAAVIVDAPAVAGLTERALPRRAGTFLVCGTEPDGPGYAAAVAVGAQLLVQLPAAATTLLRALADAGRTPATSEGRVLTVLSAHGGAGGSVFAAALALRSGDALLVDLDPFGGGIDRMLGIRSPGPRWADIAVAHGGLDFPSLRQVLPRVGGISVLASGPEAPGSAAVEAVLDAGRRGGTTVVCDAVRTPGPSDIAVAGADLAVLCAQATLRGAAAGAVTAGQLRRANPNAGLVVRGPAPGGLRAADIAGEVGLPLLGAMRPQPQLAEQLERGGLQLAGRSPLARGADQVLRTLARAVASGRVA